MRRFGIATWTFAGDSLLDKAKCFAEMGYDAASVQGDFLSGLSARDTGDLSSFIEARDIVLTVHTGFKVEEGVVDGRSALRQTEDILTWHASTGRVACLTYDIPWTEIHPGVWRQEVDLVSGPLEDVLTRTAGSGIRVGLEDCPLYATHLPALESWRRIFPHHGTLIDLGHMNMRLTQPSPLPVPDPPADSTGYMRRIPSQIIEIHVHNNNGTKDQHGPPYQGTLDMKAAASALNDVGFEGISTIEIVPGWCGLDEQASLPAAQESLHFWKDCLEG